MRNVLPFLDALAAEGSLLETLADKEAAEKAEAGYIRRYKKWRKSTLSIFEYLQLTDFRSEAGANSPSFSSGTPDQIGHVTGLIESARDLIHNGFIGNIRHLLHAEMFENVREQARALLASGHVIPAAVLGRIIVEGWLRDTAELSGIQIKDGASLSAINESLKKAAVFPIPKWRQVQAQVDIGNSAAHGNSSEFTVADVEKLLEFIEVNCIEVAPDTGPRAADF
jgi:hypothetical protein